MALLAARSDISTGLFKRTWFTDWVSCLFALAMACAAVALFFVLPEKPYIALVPFVAFAFATVLWRVPSFPILVLLWMSTMVEIYPLGFTDGTTERLGLWNNLSTLGLKGVPVSPAELLMVGGLLVWIVRGLFSQTLELRGSDLVRPYLLYLIVVALALVHGLVTGAAYNIALWEIRTQVYGLLVFFLLLNTLQTRKHFEIVTWFMILGTGLKGLQGAYRYMITLGGSFGGDAILEHDEGFFFPAYYLLTLLLFVFGGTRRQKQVAVTLMPFVMIADLANKRRASTGSLVIALIALVFIFIAVLPRRRVRILVISGAGLLLCLVYGAAFWGSDSKLAQPVRAIKSAITPDPRDESSNRYRDQEDFNLMTAIRENVILGRGYGHIMPNVAGMVNLEATDPFIQYRPHNSILWVWWRAGILGAMLFWMGMGLAIIRHCFIARATSDPYIRRWAVFSVSVIIMVLMQSWWDMGQFRYRVIVYAWMVLAVVEALWRQSGEKLSTLQQEGPRS